MLISNEMESLCVFQKYKGGSFCMKRNVTVLVEVAIIAALAMAMSFIPKFVGWFTPSWGAIVLVIFSLRRGLTPGLAAGLLWGLLHFPLGKVEFLSVEQVLIEYLVAFSAMGLAGLLYGPFQKALKDQKEKAALLWAVLAGFLAVGVRYFLHYIAGVIFWGKFAPAGTSPELYSFTVNGTAALGTFAVVVIACVLLIRQKKIWIAK